MKPEILMPGEFAQADVEKLKSKPGTDIRDILDGQIRELLRCRNPGSDSYRLDKPASDMDGAWVYYPWSRILIHCVGPDELYELRTNRNQNLVTKVEQQKLKLSTIGVAGMSVGGGIAQSLVYSGISSHIKIADNDTLDTSNLNRLRESLASVGMPKVTLTSQRLYELDPFLEIEEFDQGIDEGNIKDFFDKPPIGLVIDEIDDFKMKLMLRHRARNNKIPVLMFTSLGDNILVDIERFDIDPSRPIFHGLLGDTANEIESADDIGPDLIKKLSITLVGQEYVPTRALESLMQMGTELVGRPQLFGTIATDSGLAAYLVRKIILGETKLAGRYFIKFSELFGLPASDLEGQERQAILARLIGNG